MSSTSGSGTVGRAVASKTRNPSSNTYWRALGDVVKYFNNDICAKIIKARKSFEPFK